MVDHQLISDGFVHFHACIFNPSWKCEWSCLSPDCLWKSAFYLWSINRFSFTEYFRHFREWDIGIDSIDSIPSWVGEWSGTFEDGWETFI